MAEAVEHRVCQAAFHECGQEPNALSFPLKIYMLSERQMDAAAEATCGGDQQLFCRTVNAMDRILTSPGEAGGRELKAARAIAEFALASDEEEEEEEEEEEDDDDIEWLGETRAANDILQ
jgi:hypothetical protein